MIPLTKSIARILIAGAAAASFALPASPASASCSVTIQDCINELLDRVAISDICIPMGHTPPVCVGPVST